MPADPRPLRLARGCSCQAAAGPSLGAPCGDPDRGLLPALCGVQGTQVGPGSGSRPGGSGPGPAGVWLREPGRAASSSAGRLWVPGPEDRGEIGAGIGNGIAEGGKSRSGTGAVAAAGAGGRGRAPAAAGAGSRARQEDGASLEQALDRGWKRAGQGDRPCRPRDPIGTAAPSAPPPAPRADTEPRHSPRGMPSPGSPVATALPCERQRPPPPPSCPHPPPNERGCSAVAGSSRSAGAAAPAPLVPGAGLEEARSPRKAGSTSCAWGLQGRSCPWHAEGVGTGVPDSTDTAKRLPAAPRPGAALNRHAGMLQPRQMPLTAQKDPEEWLALPGNGGTGHSLRGSDSKSCL
ncbi:spidroin-2-like [Anomalospiza imberbis]|uniref:spidroin-2-like n=1 Tax=Anomalospiza imberbis TaxID=187417 RepID=UPI0035902861